jgi:hypothetical protein
MTVLRLSELLGKPVMLDGRRLGRLADLEVEAGGEHPALVGLEVRRWRQAAERISWHEQNAVGPEGIDCASRSPAPVRPGVLSLRRYVLDAQVIDLTGKRVVRVGEVLLADSAPGPRLVGFETGAVPVLRRLGLGRLVRGTEPVVLDWDDLHLPGLAGRELQLDVARAGIHRLSPKELAGVVGRLPHPQAARVLEAAGPGHAAAARDALSRRPKRPRFGRVLRARHRAPS